MAAVCCRLIYGGRFSMSWIRSFFDSALESTARASLRLLGRLDIGSEDHLLPQDDRDMVLARTHDLRRNNPVAIGTMKAMIDNVLGSRLVFQARTKDPKWNRKAEKFFRRWSRSVSADGRFDLAGVFAQCVNARLFDGEILLVPASDGTLQLVESERLRPPAGEKQAYKLDKRGRVTAWSVANRDADGRIAPQAPTVTVRDAIHIAWRTRPDQVRGWPELSTVANTMADIGEINSANLKKYKMGALNAWVLSGGGQLKGRNARATGGARSLAEFKDGSIFELEQGQSLQAFQNNSPGGEYAPFVQIQLQLISMALRLPYEFLLMYFAGSNFSASRTALLQAGKTIKSWQDWLWPYMESVIAWRIAKAIGDGDLPPAPVDDDGRSEWDHWEWTRPALDWIDPQSAIQSEQEELRLGVTTLSDVAAARGRDLEETLERKARDLKLVLSVAEREGISAEALSDNQIPGQAPITIKETDDVQTF